MSNRWIVSAFAAVFVITALAPADAGAPRRFRVRFHAVQTGGPVEDPARCAPPTEVVFLEGDGGGGGLGPATLSASHCIIDDPDDPDFTDGLMTITARRGEIFLSYSGTDTAGVLEGVFTITGGTGDYAGASGGGTLSGVGSATAQEGSGVLDGWIE